MLIWYMLKRTSGPVPLESLSQIKSKHDKWVGVFLVKLVQHGVQTCDSYYLTVVKNNILYLGVYTL